MAAEYGTHWDTMKRNVALSELTLGSPRCFYGAYLAPGLIHLDKQEDTGYRETSAPGTCRLI